MSWQCPYATKFKGQRFFSCKKAMKDGVDYNIKENQLTVFCASQYWCPECGQVKNTPRAKECYGYHRKS